MMECYIVRDLLPGVADGLVSSETQRDVLAHLESCPDCRLRYERMKAPMAPAPLPGGKREINFLKKIKASTVRKIAAAAGSLVVVFGALTWIFAIGTRADSTDVAVTTRIDKVSYPQDGTVTPAYLDQEWVIRLELTNGKALNTRNEYLFRIDENGRQQPVGCVIIPYSVQPSFFLFEAVNYTFCYSRSGTQPPAGDFTVTVRYRDKDVVYSMTGEGFLCRSDLSDAPGRVKKQRDRRQK
jgi:hypothetical protein